MNNHLGFGLALPQGQTVVLSCTTAATKVDACKGQRRTDWYSFLLINPEEDC